MQIISIHDEKGMMEKARSDSITLIQHTSTIQPIKIIIEIHDLIDLNLKIEQSFKCLEGEPIWDISALKEINRNRCEIMVFHHANFKPFSILIKYNNDLVKLLNIISLRIQNKLI